MRKIKRIKIFIFSIIFFALIFMAIFCLYEIKVKADETTNGNTMIIACSDFQYDSGPEANKAIVAGILEQIDTSNGVDGLFCCGDYNIGTTNQASIDVFLESTSSLNATQTVLLKGNHDATGFTGLSPSGDNDPASDDYGVFVINENDYMWHNSNEATIKQTAKNLIDYLNDKLEKEYDKPIFVVSHLALNYSLRTKNDGDGMYANYIFDVLNQAGEQGLNIFYLFGHNHSNGWDDYLGGSCVYLGKGEDILIAQSSKTAYESCELNFTYLNAGYVGYYRNVNNLEDVALTMTKYDISDSSVVISRYSADGVEPLKMKGTSNTYKGGEAYEANESVVESPQTVALTDVTEMTPISYSIIGITDTNDNQGEDQTQTPDYENDRCIKISSINSISEEKTYLFVYNNQIVSTNSVEKSNGSTARVGFDIVSLNFDTSSGIITERKEEHEWSFKKSDSGWLVGRDGKYISFRSTTDKGVVAELTEEGENLIVSSSTSGFNFWNITSTYCLNYNNRGVINGYASNPATLSVYEVIPRAEKEEETLYKITFLNYDGTIIEEKDYRYGDAVIQPTTIPTKESDGTYSYTFKGWDKDIVTVTEDVTYTAQYEATLVQPPNENEKTEAFVVAVESITTTSLEENYTTIISAIRLYNALTESEMEAVQESYQILRTAIDAYNKEIEEITSTHLDAVRG